MTRWVVFDEQDNLRFPELEEFQEVLKNGPKAGDRWEAIPKYPTIPDTGLSLMLSRADLVLIRTALDLKMQVDKEAGRRLDTEAWIMAEALRRKGI